MAARHCSERAEVRRWSGGNLPRTHPSGFGISARRLRRLRSSSEMSRGYEAPVTVCREQRGNASGKRFNQTIGATSCACLRNSSPHTDQLRSQEEEASRD